MMWQTLANGEIQTTVELFCLTMRTDRYIRYVIRNSKGVLVSGSEDTMAAAMSAVSFALRRLLAGCLMQKDQIEGLLLELESQPVPLTKPQKSIHPA